MRSDTTEKISNSKPFSLLWPVFSVVSLSAGIYHGYCRASGMPIENEGLETLLLFGPTIAQASIYGVVGGLFGSISGKKADKNFDWGDSLSERAAKQIGGSKIGALYGIAFCAPYGAVKGSIQNMFGFGLGYIAGNIAK